MRLLQFFTLVRILLITLLLLAISLIIFFAINQQEFAVACTAQAVQERIMSLQEQNVVVILDIDDTIITPKSLTFRNPPYNKLIDEIKANRHNYPNYQTILSNWRQERQAMLIDNDWPQIIEQLKSQYPVVALTKMDTGAFGTIASMERWRLNEMYSLNVEFSDISAIDSADDHDAVNPPSFKHGIMMTGSWSKARTLQKYLPLLGPIERVVFVDDRINNLQEIKQFCQDNAIPFLGIHYQGLAQLPGEPQNEDIFQLQKHTLIEEARWLRDEEAASLLQR